MLAFQQSSSDRFTQELYIRSPVSSLAHFLLAGLYILSAHSYFFDHVSFRILILFIFLSATIRFVLAKNYFEFTDRLQMIVHDSSVLVTAVSWGALSYFTVMHLGVSSVLSYPIFILGSGVASGGTFSLSPKPKLAYAFVFFILSPAAVAVLFQTPSEAGWLLTLLILVYSMFLMLQSKSNYEMLKKNFELFDLILMERKKSEEAHLEIMKQKENAIHSARLAELGTMAGSIAHEINNPLAVILAKTNMILYYLKMDPLPKEKVSLTLTKINETVGRITKIVRGLRMFSRNSENDPFLEHNLDEIIDDTLTWCKPRIDQLGIELSCELRTSHARVNCHDSQLSQVILNLCNNAIDAIEHHEEKWVKIQTSVKDGFIELSITDSGHGIPPEVAEKMMAPFFTTKEHGKGTGLGLSISYGIIQSHSGHLLLDQTCQNTRFIIRLPVSSMVSLPIAG